MFKKQLFRTAHTQKFTVAILYTLRNRSVHCGESSLQHATAATLRSYRARQTQSARC